MVANKRHSFSIDKINNVRYNKLNVRNMVDIMTISPTQLRANLYKILDRVLETRKPIEIIRNGQLLEISVKNSKSKVGGLANLKPHPNTINGNPEDLAHMDWSSYWQGYREL